MKRKSYEVEEKVAYVKEYLAIKSAISESKFADSKKIPKTSFFHWMQTYRSGHYAAARSAAHKRIRPQKFAIVSQKFYEYMQLRQERTKFDKLGLPYAWMQEIALRIAQKHLSEELLPEFHASSGWINDQLKYGGFIGIRMHGEGGEVCTEDTVGFRLQVQEDIAALCMEFKITKDRIYNADQSGLFYQNIPNRTYCNKENRSDIRGTKAMNDKNRITLMICTSAGGVAIPIAIVGKSEKPHCFRNHNIVLPYTSQDNAWFDRSVTQWWVKTVFIPHCRNRHSGDQHVLLLLDNRTVHSDISLHLPSNIHVYMFPPKCTSHLQPADTGIISTIKVGYKMKLLHKLLEVYDRDDAKKYIDDLVTKLKPKSECKGILFGAKPHVRDAMDLLVESVNEKLSCQVIQRCWRKAACLPVGMLDELYEEAGTGNHTVDNATLDSICDMLSCLNTKIVSYVGGEGAKAPDFAIDTLLDPSAHHSDQLISLTNAQIREGVQNWIGVEDCPAILDAQLFEHMLDNKSKEGEASMIDNDDELEEEAEVMPSQSTTLKELTTVSRYSSNEVKAAMDILDGLFSQELVDECKICSLGKQHTQDLAAKQMNKKVQSTFDRMFVKTPATVKIEKHTPLPPPTPIQQLVLFSPVSESSGTTVVDNRVVQTKEVDDNHLLATNTSTPETLYQDKVLITPC